MSTYSRTSGSIACTACPASWTPTALETALAAASGGGHPGSLGASAGPGPWWGVEPQAPTGAP
eukprot:9346017-Alexandrium_andersonii.AAC.1